MRSQDRHENQLMDIDHANLGSGSSSVDKGLRDRRMGEFPIHDVQARGETRIIGKSGIDAFLCKLLDVWRGRGT